MITDETGYTFSQATINDYKNKRGSYYTDDNVTIIKQTSLDSMDLANLYI